MKRVFEYVRYVVFIAVVGLLLAGIAALLFGGVMTVSIILENFRRAEFNVDAARLLSTDLIELIDLYLLGTVLLITSIGLYQLFINPHIVLPEWLSVTNLEQLKFNLLAVIVVMLAILFLSAAASAPPEHTGFLAYGAAVALVLAAIAVVVWVFARAHRSMEELKHQELTQQEQLETAIEEHG
jgi:uncharacterized membrane protein YqhA